MDHLVLILRLPMVLSFDSIITLNIMHTDSHGTAASGNKADRIADGVSRVYVVAIYTQNHI